MEEQATYKPKKTGIWSKLFFTFAFVYYASTAIWIFLALFFHDFIKDMAALYIDEFAMSNVLFFLLLLLVFGLYAMLLTGLLFMYKGLPKLGLIFFLTSSLIILGLQTSIINSVGYHKLYLDLGIMVAVILFQWVRMAQKA